jgi:hypothetical protein
MTHETDNGLRDQIRNTWPAPGREPAFSQVWQSARQRHAAVRRRNQQFAGAAVVVAAVVIAFFAESPSEHSYIEVADLMESTYWTAPSDVLLPEREFDIYQDMPVLFESTEPAGGTLL